jgi:hypothetical protein
MRKILILCMAAAFLAPADDDPLSHITAESLRGHLSFIASDALEGRATPSRGLDLAAEYIAAQFRRSGLEPAGDDGYFQTATVNVREQNPDGFEMTVTGGGRTIHVDPRQTSILQPVKLDNMPITTSAQDSAGKVVVMLSGRGPASIGNIFGLYAGRGGPQVVDPEAPRGGFLRNSVNSPELIDLLKNAPDARITLHVSAPIERSVKVRNVAGILRGSDPALRDTFVLLTAHYDHLGVGFDGANDDGSGTVSVVEIAGAIASMNPHPKRSILFMTFFGEERGLLGSRYYGRHPLVPVAKTIADLNLEQIGRTDSTVGPQIANASITGFDFSDVPTILADAGKANGIKVYKDPQASDAYFARSDNQALADLGVPAHTLCVAFDYPDYHGMGDHWEKVDYANMAKVDRAVAAGLLRMASDEPPPKWNESNPAAKKYVEAARKLR